MITQTTNVQILPFNQVDDDFAFKEGDRSLAYWRKVHHEFSSEELRSLDKHFNEEMLVVCEEFKVVYK